MDIRYILQARSHDAMSGIYYPVKPKVPGDNGTRFNYEAVDPKETAYRRIFANVIDTDSATLTIKTVFNIGFKAKGYVVLKDGTMYQIVLVGEDESAVVSKQAFRNMRSAAGVEYYLRLIEVENPWEVS